MWTQRKRYVPADDVDRVRRQLRRNKARDTGMMGLLSQARRLRGAVAERLRGRIDDEQLMGVCNGIATSA